MIREAEPTDDLSALLTQLGYPTSKEVAKHRLEKILASNGAAFVSEEDESLTGFIHVIEGFGIEHDAFAQIRALVVDEAHRNRKLGEQLVARGETWARERGLGVVIVYSNVVRTRARKFYERLGYTVVKTSNVFEKTL
jgi:GNAT superfamily N-acetyltransferase